MTLKRPPVFWSCLIWWSVGNFWRHSHCGEHSESTRGLNEIVHTSQVPERPYSVAMLGVPGRLWNSRRDTINYLSHVPTAQIPTISGTAHLTRAPTVVSNLKSTEILAELLKTTRVSEKPKTALSSRDDEYLRYMYKNKQCNCFYKFKLYIHRSKGQIYHNSAYFQNSPLYPDLYYPGNLQASPINIYFDICYQYALPIC